MVCLFVIMKWPLWSHELSVKVHVNFWCLALFCIFLYHYFSILYCINDQFNVLLHSLMIAAGKNTRSVDD